ncbi:hypothetical protein EMIHUDRAFT_464373 [Emiliania huxleyi CCMP1516]|uniref:F-box domain-containing protein n=2 Tax=Emiliania huxleyi TaxID=2903 RepID=A0A0D3IXJ6_EMIH1|nr:hypothetical protein EMIHUDRAFT_464373 [Emiliania huxleyi CCMP1516]EOD15981.1 hypothetical protein EMIHUDRAFT_464373 [Emiliania huxleyi CCMP1516]|eukprot:XP_005768410.1 hypothetical protein EMIHUDRAFT_464373 [Emiliania huxleyi CCMP1516]
MCMCTRASPASIPPPDVATFVSLPHDLLCRILAAVPNFDGASCLNAIGLAAKACSALGAAAADEETWRRVAVARCIGVTLRTDSWREAVLGAREAACERLTDASAGVAVCALPIRVASPSRDAPVVSMSSCAAPLGVKQRHFDEAVERLGACLFDGYTRPWVADWLLRPQAISEPLRALALCHAARSSKPSSLASLLAAVPPRTLSRTVELRVSSFSEKRDCRGFRARDERKTLTASVLELALSEDRHPIWATLRRGVVMEVRDLTLSSAVESPLSA